MLCLCVEFRFPVGIHHGTRTSEPTDSRRGHSWWAEEKTAENGRWLGRLPRWKWRHLADINNVVVKILLAPIVCFSVDFNVMYIVAIKVK